MSQAQSAMPVLTRFAIMAVSWGAIGIVYTLSGLRGAEDAYQLTPSAIDLWFGFEPAAIWIYMSFFVFVPLGFFATPPHRVKWLCYALWVSAVGAGVVFAMFPTTMIYPTVTQDGLSAATLRVLMRYDAVVNCLPSLHVTLTSLVLFALWEKGRMVRNLVLGAWATAIMVSIIPLHRHQFVDLLAGLALALFACVIVSWIERFLVAKREPAT